MLAHTSTALLVLLPTTPGIGGIVAGHMLGVAVGSVISVEDAERVKVKYSEELLFLCG
ncbi:hypothetical protein IG193_04350 [Infirmifilum lucidum]|uniref:Uncharacterized protein n=1 Tax=Infirmifilum lucidum TaxID=2776706 RepID=A0A7L9FJ62_9CREN|nr:hypothetical protein [Infirmifilum lucidum]QOJ79691.1 hypothetical protein IG193_04350 [Infirmifilum lucidum]